MTGKVYLRLLKSESESRTLLKKKLLKSLDKEGLIYVISEKDHINLLPEQAFKVLVQTDLNTIKERFKARVRGNLPIPVEQMLERNHGKFDLEEHDFHYDGTNDTIELIGEQIKNNINIRYLTLDK